MKRITVIAAAVGAAALAWYMWPVRGEAVPQPVGRTAAPPSAPVARGDDGPQWMQAMADQPPQEPERVPLEPVDSSTPAWLSLAEARENGDPRTPPVVHDDPATQAQPTAAQLADPQAYRQFEQGQHARLLASFAEAAKDEVPRLRSDLERGRAAGVPEAELAKMQEKIRRIEALRDEVAGGAIR
ncbi:hypothetical protein GCM10027277_11690 [Pseudoduganella ginsengisoli]|uniref:Uncharacterized protein n=1 Tax=Pseudoduganella ginsengisoli TaxID=1462440 RepID=A0A6L6PWM6_9BURK|nr:hypothetical protein [Pseudoduganella ginsengisoli]MTW01564.1 hypothetical protein [Pseudoduganella ginsengisoli]